MKKPHNIHWARISDRVCARLMEEVRKWEGTPFMRNQQARLMGVDCTRLVGGILDALYRVPPTSLPRHADSLGAAAPNFGRDTLQAMRKAYPVGVVPLSQNSSIEPGDVIVTRGVMDENAPPEAGHVLLALDRPWTFFHAIPERGACYASIQGLPGLLAIYRPKEKSRWA